MHPNCRHSPIEPSTAEAKVKSSAIAETFANCPFQQQCTTRRQGRSVSNHPDEQLFVKLHQRQVAPADRAQLRQGVQATHTLTLSIVMAGITAMSLLELTPEQWMPNSSQLADRPALPDRGIPTEREPAGTRAPWAEIEMPLTSPAHVQWIPNSLKLEDQRPDPPDRGIPTEREPAGTRAPCVETEMPFTPLPQSTDSSLGYRHQPLSNNGLGQALLTQSTEE